MAKRMCVAVRGGFRGTAAFESAGVAQTVLTPKSCDWP